MGRGPRFTTKTREEEETVEITPTPNFIRLLDRIWRHKRINTKQLLRVYRNDKGELIQYENMTGKLRKLTKAKLVKVPPHQRLLWIERGGTKPNIYMLSNKGARLLRNNNRNIPANPKYDETSEELTASGLEHDLYVTETLTKAEASANLHEHISFKNIEELLVPPDDNSFTPNNWKKARLQLANTHIETDGIFGIHNLLRDRTRYVPLELDAGTRTISSEDYKSVEKQMEKYVKAFNAGEHKKQWGFTNMSVLYVVKTETRKKNLIKVANKLTTKQLFYFTTFDEVENCEDLLTLPLITNTKIETNLLS